MGNLQASITPDGFAGGGIANRFVKQLEADKRSHAKSKVPLDLVADCDINDVTSTSASDGKATYDCSYLIYQHQTIHGQPW